MIDKPKHLTYAELLAWAEREPIVKAIIEARGGPIKRFHLPIAVLPDKRKDCCCTPETCICAPKKRLRKSKGSGKVKRK